MISIVERPNPSRPGERSLRPYNADPSTRRVLRAWLTVVLSLWCFAFGFAYALIAPFLMAYFAAPVVILLAAVIWALPDTTRAPTRTLYGLFLALFTTSVIWPNYLAIALPGMPWITVLRLTGFPLVLVLLVSISTSPQFRATLSGAVNACPRIWQLLVAVSLIQFLSIAFSSSIAQSINKFTIAQLSWTAIFFVSAYVFLTPRRVETWAVLLWAMAMIIGIDAIFEFHMQHVPWAGHIPGFLKIDSVDVQRMLAGQVRGATGLYRVQGPFTTSLGLGEYLALTMPFVIHFTVGGYRWFIRMAAAISAPFLIYIVVLTDSRLGMIGCILSFMLYLLVWAIFRWRRERQSLFGIAITLAYPAMAAVVFALTLISHQLHAKVWGNGPQDASNQSRHDQIAMGMPKVWDHPWGHGIGMGAEVLGYLGGNDTLTIDNDYLRIALEYGVIGFIIYYGMFLATIWYAATGAANDPRTNRDYAFLIPICIAITNFFIIKSVFSQQDNHPLVFMMMGIVCALTYRINQERKPSGALPARSASA